MNVNKLAIAVAVTALLTQGCASYRPVVDTRGVNAMQYEADLAECQTYAQQVDPVAQGLGAGAAGAAFGAVLGAAIGAALGADVGQMAAFGAAQGGVTGVGAGGAHGANSQMNIIKVCMSGRGYKVLN